MIKENNKKVTVLSSGLRVVTEKNSSSDSVSMAVGFNVGLINENKKNNGISHFLEHMAFKGTEGKNVNEIALEIDSIGGVANAFTSDASTVYYITGLSEDIGKISSILSDIVQRSSFPEQEVETEKGVVCQEITLYNDDPYSSLIMGMYANMFTEESPLSMSILGPSSNIKAFARDDFFNHVKNFYFPENTVVSIAGNVDHEEMVKMIEKDFDAMAKKVDKQNPKISQYKMKDTIINKDNLQQLKVVVFFDTKITLLKDKDKAMKLSFIQNALSSGFSSFMFKRIRDQYGLSYSLGSDYDSINNNANFSFYADVDYEKLETLFKAFFETMEYAVNEFDESEVKKGIKKAIAKDEISKNSISSKVISNLHGLMFYNSLDMNERKKKILKSTTAEEFRAVFKEAIKESVPSVGVIGSLDDERKKAVEKLISEFKGKIKSL